MLGGYNMIFARLSSITSKDKVPKYSNLISLDSLSIIDKGK